MQIPRFIIVCFFAILGIGLGKYWLEEQKIDRLAPDDMEQNQVSFQAESIKRFSFGYDGLIASLAWIQTLQRAEVRPLEKGQRSWEYAQLRLITTLDPNFEVAYWFGALQLSVFRRDNEGARDILERWVYRSPNRWQAYYLLGYHLYFEMNQHQEAASYLLRAAQMEG